MLIFFVNQIFTNANCLAQLSYSTFLSICLIGINIFLYNFVYIFVFAATFPHIVVCFYNNKRHF